MNYTRKSARNLDHVEGDLQAPSVSSERDFVASLLPSTDREEAIPSKKGSDSNVALPRDVNNSELVAIRLTIESLRQDRE